MFSWLAVRSRMISPSSFPRGLSSRLVLSFLNCCCPLTGSFAASLGASPREDLECLCLPRWRSSSPFLRLVHLRVESSSSLFKQEDVSPPFTARLFPSRPAVDRFGAAERGGDRGGRRFLFLQKGKSFCLTDTFISRWS